MTRVLQGQEMSNEKAAAESSRRVARVVEQVEESADRRTVLAADRTIFAAERTYAAWVRTGLASLAAGVGAKAALGETIPATIVVTSGCALVLFSIFCFVAAVWRQLIPGVPPPKPDVYRLPAALLVFINGILIAISAAAVVAICLALRR
jgi:putative membrane protein